MTEERKLTLKQKRFADKYLEYGNATQAAFEVYDTEDRDTAKAIACENLTKLYIQHYIQKDVDAIKNNQVRLALSAKSEQVQCMAGEKVLDRALGKAKESVEVTNTGERTINIVSIESVYNKLYMFKDKEDKDTKMLEGAEGEEMA
jgi:phage terminase small subunit